MLFRSTKGTVQVVVRLADQPLALAVGPNAKRVGSSMTMDQRRAYMAMLKTKQDALSTQVKALGGREDARVSKAHNAVVFTVNACAPLTVDPSAIPAPPVLASVASAPSVTASL